MKWEIWILITFFIIFLIKPFLRVAYGGVKIIISIYYFIKNNFQPVKLPRYKWVEVQLDSISGYEWAKAKFYVTKNWVEFYAWMFGNNDNVDRKEKRFIIPKWKVLSYKEGVMKILLSRRDYLRYKRWHRK